MSFWSRLLWQSKVQKDPKKIPVEVLPRNYQNGFTKADLIQLGVVFAEKSIDESFESLGLMSSDFEEVVCPEGWHLHFSPGGFWTYVRDATGKNVAMYFYKNEPWEKKIYITRASSPS